MFLLCYRGLLLSLLVCPAMCPAAAAPAAGGASQIAMPITVSLRALFAEAESQLPREMGSGDAWEPVSGGSSLRVRYAIRRGPLDLSLAGPSVRASTEIAYSFWAKRVAFPVIVVGCGTGDEAPRRARLDLQTHVSIAPPWQLQAVSQVRFEPIDRCKVSLLKVDVTDRIQDAAQREMARLAVEHIDRPISASPLLRDLAADAWRRLQAPLPLSDDLWLRVRPRAVGLSGIDGEGDTLRVLARLTCAPEVVAGTRPAPETLPLPELALGSPGGGSGFRVTVDGSVPFAEAGRLLQRELATDGKTGKPRVFRSSGFSLGVTDATVAGAGDRVRLTIAFAGSLKGTLTLAGRLQYDPQAQCIYATGVDYTLETKNTFVRGTNALLRESLRRAIERGARWPVQGGVREARERLDGALNRNLGDGVTLSGKVRALTPLAVAATPSGLHVRVLAEGDAALQVTP